MKRYYIFFAALAAFSIAAILANYSVRQGPIHDNKVEDDLSSIEVAVENYVSKNDKLPQSLSDVTVTDSDTKSRLSEYTYRTVSKDTYELCATFQTQHHDKNSANTDYYTDTSNHNKGLVCFSYHTSLYEPYEPVATPTPTPYRTPTPTPTATPVSNKLCQTTLGSNVTYMTPKTISSLDTANHSMSLNISTGGTFYLYWPVNQPIAYDASCNAITFSTLKVGDRIQAYYTSGNSAVVVQKQ